MSVLKIFRKNVFYYIIFNLLFLFYAYGCLSACMSAGCICSTCGDQKGVSDPSGTGVTASFELLCGAGD